MHNGLCPSFLLEGQVDNGKGHIYKCNGNRLRIKLAGTPKNFCFKDVSTHSFRLASCSCTQPVFTLDFFAGFVVFPSKERKAEFLLTAAPLC